MIVMRLSSRESIIVAEKDNRWKIKDNKYCCRERSNIKDAIYKRSKIKNIVADEDKIYKRSKIRNHCCRDW